MDYLLDTNIVLIYLRQSGLKEELDRRLSLFSPENTLLISVDFNCGSQINRYPKKMERKR